MSAIQIWNYILPRLTSVSAHFVKLETRKFHLYIRLNEFPVLQGSAVTQIIWDEKYFIYFYLFIYVRGARFTIYLTIYRKIILSLS